MRCQHMIFRVIHRFVRRPMRPVCVKPATRLRMPSHCVQKHAFASLTHLQSAQMFVILVDMFRAFGHTETRAFGAIYIERRWLRRRRDGGVPYAYGGVRTSNKRMERTSTRFVR
jgi:hypothetical protein